MSDHPFFSVILPAHNSAKFIDAQLVSIMRQSFRDFELIVICDACTDNTADVVRSYKDTMQVIVLEVDFGKAGLARNAGLDIARGEWILFSDDDDWWLHDYAFETIHDWLTVHSDCDIMAYGFYWRRGERSILTNFMQPSGALWVAPWTKAWRRDFIGEHRFPDWLHSDDLGFAQEMFPLIKTWACIPAPMYYYNYMHEGSTQWKLKTGELQSLEEMGLI